MVQQRQTTNDTFVRLPQRFFVAVEPDAAALAGRELAEAGCAPAAVDGGWDVELDAVQVPALLRTVRLAARWWWTGPQVPLRNEAALAELLAALPMGCLPGRIEVAGQGVAPARLGWLQAAADRWLLQRNPGPDRLLLRADRDGVQLRADAGGGPLYQRGWRTEQGEAPLRETLAARLLVQAGWTGWQPGGPSLWDPMCGSGTLVVEAATLGRPLPAGLRSFALERWLATAGVAVAAPAAVPWPDGLPALFASDQDQVAVARTEANLLRAGVTRGVQVWRAEVGAARPMLPKDGLVVCNPPWGERLLGRNEARRLVERLAASLRRHAPGWRLGVLLPEAAAATAFGARDLRVVPFAVGGKRVWLATGRLPG